MRRQRNCWWSTRSGEQLVGCSTHLQNDQMWKRADRSVHQIARKNTGASLSDYQTAKVAECIFCNTSHGRTQANNCTTKVSFTVIEAIGPSSWTVVVVELPVIQAPLRRFAHDVSLTGAICRGRTVGCARPVWSRCYRLNPCFPPGGKGKQPR